MAALPFKVSFNDDMRKITAVPAELLASIRQRFVLPANAPLALACGETDVIVDQLADLSAAREGKPLHLTVRLAEDENPFNNASPRADASQLEQQAAAAGDQAKSAKAQAKQLLEAAKLEAAKKMDEARAAKSAETEFKMAFKAAKAAEKAAAKANKKAERAEAFDSPIPPGDSKGTWNKNDWKAWKHEQNTAGQWGHEEKNKWKHWKKHHAEWNKNSCGWGDHQGWGQHHGWGHSEWNDGRWGQHHGWGQNPGQNQWSGSNETHHGWGQKNGQNQWCGSNETAGWDQPLCDQTSCRSQPQSKMDAKPEFEDKSGAKLIQGKLVNWAGEHQASGVPGQLVLLPSGRVCFQAQRHPGNLRVSDQLELQRGGGRGPRAQFEPLPTEDKPSIFRLLSHAHRAADAFLGISTEGTPDAAILCESGGARFVAVDRASAAGLWSFYPEGQSAPLELKAAQPLASAPQVFAKLCELVDQVAAETKIPISIEPVSDEQQASEMLNALLEMLPHGLKRMAMKKLGLRHFEVKLPDGWGSLLEDLKDMGFEDAAENKRALQATQGDLKKAVKQLVQASRHATQ